MSAPQTKIAHILCVKIINSLSWFLRELCTPNFKIKHVLYTISKLPTVFCPGGGGGHTNLNGYGCKAHTSKGWGIRWEHNLKKWGVTGWEAKFWFKIRGHWVSMFTFDPSVSAFKAGIWKKKSSKMAKMINWSMKLKQKVTSCGSWMQKIGGLWVKAIEEPTFHQKRGSLGDSRDNQQKYGVIGWQQHWK